MDDKEANLATESQHATSIQLPLEQQLPAKGIQINDDLERGLVHTDSSIDSPNIVIDWNGKDDPEMPLNWPQSKKWKNLLTVAVLTLLTPFASTTFASAIDQVLQEMHSTNRDLGSFTVSSYLLGYAFGPLFLAPSSEIWGRLPVYHTCTVLFMVTNVVCAKSTSLAMLIVFRFMTGVFGAGPLTLGPGTIADCFRQEQRGKGMAVYTMPVLLGPCLGPAVGAYVGRAWGWRWDFWLLVIMSAVVFILCLILQDETHPPTLLERRARKMRKATGNNQIFSKLKPNLPRKIIFKTSIIRPTKMLFLSPIVFGLSLLTAVAYGTLYLLFTTIGDVFATRYGIVKNVGLVYLGIGLGQLVAILVFGMLSDTIVKRMSKSGEMKPEYRLPLMVPGGAMIPIGLLLYGWTSQYEVHWIVPIIGTALIGAGMITVFTPVGAYLVDAFPEYAASATAANTVFRSIGGALLPLAGSRMYATLDQGWGSTLLAGISLGMMGMIWIALKYGERLRTHPKYQIKL